MSTEPTVAVIDFETTGSSPAQGARATEIAAVLVRGGQVVDRYQSLMRSGAWVPPFIEQLTGISNAMLAGAPPADAVMREVSAFTHGCVLVAHNAAFDRQFWAYERRLAGCLDDAGWAEPGGTVSLDRFACTLMLSRRLYPEAPNHKLGTLVQWHGITPTGRAHRALADAEATAALWQCLVRDVGRRFAAEVPAGLMCALQRAPRHALDRAVSAYFAAQAAAVVEATA